MKYTFVLLAIGCLVTPANAQWLDTTIALPETSYPFAFCYNSENDKVYCANMLGYTVGVIDGATNLLAALLPTGGEPRSLCYNPAYNKIYCATTMDAEVVVIDGASDSVVKTIEVGRGPIALISNPAQGRIYVANCVSSTVSVLRDSDGGIEESFTHQAPNHRPEATILSGASGVKRLASCVVFDAMGRRVLNPKSGVYFVRDAQAQAVRKLLITK
jgi:YVTN family beta-propeller protein